MNNHTDDPDALLSLLETVKENYIEPLTQLKRGRKREYSSLSFLLIAVVAVITRTYKDSEIHNLLLKDKRLLEVVGLSQVPHRTTIGRRLSGLISESEEQISLLGNQVVQEIKPENDQPEVSAVDGRMYEAQGPRWHHKDRKNGIVPIDLRNVDTDSKWFKSAYRGWVQGYRLLLQGLVFPEPVPIFAAWRSNSDYEANIASDELLANKLKVTDVLLGDETFGGGQFPYLYEIAGGWVLTPKQLPEVKRSWKNDLFDYRKETIELLFQRIIQATDLKQCRVKGLGKNGAFVLASIWLYQICFLENRRKGKQSSHVKELLDCARWRISSS